MNVRGLLTFLFFVGASQDIVAETINLTVSNFKTITFEDIKPTSYSNDGDALKIAVEESASFLLLPMTEIKSVKAARFLWKTDGSLNVPGPASHLEKDGDDYFFRLGLLIHGEAPLIPFFAPKWIKTVSGHLNLPTDRLLYAVIGKETKAGARWPSPYGDQMEMVAVANEPGPDGWNRAVFETKQPMSVVGIWLMADGDNSKSRFVTIVKELQIE